MRPSQYAEVKALFAEVCDLAEAARNACLRNCAEIDRKAYGDDTHPLVEEDLAGLAGVGSALVGK